MTTIVTRTGKGSPLTHVEVDTNFTNLNTAKLEAGAIALGSAGTPSISFTGGTDGIYSPGAGTLAVSTAGVERYRTDNAGRLLVGTSTSRQVTVGVSTNWDPKLQVTKTANDAANIAAYSFSTYASDLGGGLGIGPDIVLARSNSNTEGTQAAIDNIMLLGRISFNGSNGTAFQGGAFIAAAADGQTWASGDCPTRLVFATAPDGSASPTERLRITSTGQVRLAGAGITFNGDTATANELDDYEEGTFTPTVIGSTTAGTATYSTQSGIYTKIGRLVTATIFLGYAGGTGTGDLSLSGLPFSVNNGHYFPVSIGYITGLTLTLNNSIFGYAVVGTSRIDFIQHPTGATVPYDDGAAIMVTCSYSV